MKFYKYLLVVVSGIFVSALQAENYYPWPTAVEDNVSLTTNQRVYLPVLENDTGQELEIFDVNTTTVKLGNVEIDEDSQGVYYQSANEFVGEDSFWYAFEDKFGRTNAAQVFVSVLDPEPVDPPEDPYAGWPVATIDTVTISRDETITIPVLENDSGLELNLIALNEVTVEGGSAAIQQNKIIYTPYLGFTGEDSFWYQFVDARGRKNSTQVKLTVNETVVNPPLPEPQLNFSLLGLHYEVLHGQSQIFGEQPDTYYMSLAEPAFTGATSLVLAENYDVKDGQLITYLASDGDYYTVATTNLNGRILSLKDPLAVSTGENNIWNFYKDGSHPNWYGASSIADFAIRELDEEVLNSGKHLMLGDSWMQDGGLVERLTERLDNTQIVNKAVGGRTTENILDKFDEEVEGEYPDFVWVIAGTNDYFQDVSIEDYTENMRAIIEKINNIGAKPIVIDSSVAPLMYGSSRLTDLSHSYADAIDSLLASEN